MIGILLQIINFLSIALSFLLIAYVVLSYFMDPFHPVRMNVNRIVNPILDPIRRILPQTGMVDFSPLVAIILVQVLEFILRSLLKSIAG
ncbi:MAG: YggT family protein [Anaerolineales bacterium]|nr:YggT family protein [Anaerolineales bacterium]